MRDTHGNINAFVAIKRDITRQLDLEAQLRQSQKMEAIGVLAAGIAHDFNNILAAVLGYTQLAMLDEDKNSKIAGHLEQVEKASLRARDLVQHILTFSRQTESVPRPLKLDVVLDEVLKLLCASLPRSIDFRSRVEPLAHPVLADSSQIHQVVMNLCTNAMHAMREAGVPCVPGSEGALPDDPKEIVKIGRAVGYPVIIKAAGGGGGRGMRVVHTEAALINAVNMTRSEAGAAFNNSTVAVLIPGSVPASRTLFRPKRKYFSSGRKRVNSLTQ